MRQEINKSVTLKIFETEVRIFGVEFSEFKYLLLEALLMIIIPSITDLAQIDVGLPFYFTVIIIMLATLVMLRRMAKHKYKNYILGMLSFKFKQPKLIRVSHKNE